jgi:hypothetical protein
MCPSSGSAIRAVAGLEDGLGHRGPALDAHLGCLMLQLVLDPPVTAFPPPFGPALFWVELNARFSWLTAFLRNTLYRSPPLMLGPGSNLAMSASLSCG